MWNQLLLSGRKASGFGFGMPDCISIDIYISQGLAGRRRELADAQATTDPRAPVAAELTGVEAQIDHLAEAIAMGGAMPTLVERLHGLEQRRQALAKAIDAMPVSPRLPRIEWPVLACEAGRMLQQWRDLLHDDVGDTRQVLRELVEGPLQFRRS
jgi:hypothetical protein